MAAMMHPDDGILHGNGLFYRRTAEQHMRGTGGHGQGFAPDCVLPPVPLAPIMQADTTPHIRRLVTGVLCIQVIQNG